MAWLGYYNNALTNTIRIGSKSVLVMFSMEVKMGTTSPRLSLRAWEPRLEHRLRCPFWYMGKI